MPSPNHKIRKFKQRVDVECWDSNIPLCKGKWSGDSVKEAIEWAAAHRRATGHTHSRLKIDADIEW